MFQSAKAAATAAAAAVAKTPLSPLAAAAPVNWAGRDVYDADAVGAAEVAADRVPAGSVGAAPVAEVADEELSMSSHSNY